MRSGICSKETVIKKRFLNDRLNTKTVTPMLHCRTHVHVTVRRFKYIYIRTYAETHMYEKQ